MEAHQSDGSITEAGGFLAVVGSIFMNIWNHISMKGINEFIVLITGIVGLIYMIYKLRLIVMEYKEKRKKDAEEG